MAFLAGLAMACVRGAVQAGQAGAAGRNHNKLGRFATFSTRARNAGVELDPDNPENQSAIARQVAGDIVSAQSQRTGYRLLMWNIWVFFEDPASSITVRLLPGAAGASTPMLSTASAPVLAGEVLFLPHDVDDPRLDPQLLLGDAA